MGLPTRNLDDRTFQDIVDEAKKRIAASCPSWTDHNVSDPGVTLVELFAWMTEMILYRLNQVPEKHYIKFMELLGLKLREPEPARTEVTFYLSAPQPQAITIRQGAEVATVRTEARPSIIFSTDQDLEVHPPVLAALLNVEAANAEGGEQPARTQNLQHLGVAGFEFEAFSSHPRVGDALYFGFENDLSHHVLGLEVSCPSATGLGIDPANPPWQWEGWHGGEGDARWQPAAVESDGTGGMNESGTIFVRLPRLAQRESGGLRGYWLRCRVTEPAVAGTEYDSSPRIRNIVARSWGGSVWGTHASVVKGEVLGRSDGSPGQRFTLEHSPLLRRQRGETVEVRAAGAEEAWDAWTEVPDLADSGPFDRHFTCDSASGEIRFGPALRLPDGSAHSYGAILPRGALIRFSSYRYGGGVAGNVQAGTLTVLKTSIPYVDRVTNHADATGGIDPETVEMAQMRAPQLLRSHGRAVTESDYEALARLADSRVERARCVQPTTGQRDEPLAGRVYLLLVPRVNRPEGRIQPEALRLDDDLRQAVQRYLDDYRLLSVRLDIREPEYSWVAVEISLVAVADADPERVRADVERHMYRFLNPLAGGHAGNGWPFGRDLYPSDVYSCLQAVRGVEFIESLRLYQVLSSGNRTEITGRLDVPVHGLVASAEHRVDVRLRA